jgi:hypothetical protein
MARTAGYQIIFIPTDGRPRIYNIADPNEQNAKNFVQAKYKKAEIRSCRPLDAKALLALGIEPGGAKESPFQNRVKDDPEQS